MKKLTSLLQMFFVGVFFIIAQQTSLCQVSALLNLPINKQLAKLDSLMFSSSDIVRLKDIRDSVKSFSEEKLSWYAEVNFLIKSGLNLPPNKREAFLLSQLSSFENAPFDEVKETITANVQVKPNPPIAPAPPGPPTLKGAMKIVGNLKSTSPIPIKNKIIIGKSPGLLEITGDYELDNTEVEYELEGTTAGITYDQVVVEGNVIIGDNVVLQLFPTTVESHDYVLIDNKRT